MGPSGESVPWARGLSWGENSWQPWSSLGAGAGPGPAPAADPTPNQPHAQLPWSTSSPHVGPHSLGASSVGTQRRACQQLPRALCDTQKARASRGRPTHLHLGLPCPHTSHPLRAPQWQWGHICAHPLPEATARSPARTGCFYPWCTGEHQKGEPFPHEPRSPRAERIGTPSAEAPLCRCWAKGAWAPTSQAPGSRDCPGTTHWRAQSNLVE